MITDISQLSPEVLDQLKQALAGTGVDAQNRTGAVRKPLTDLRTPRNPQARLHRPTFIPIDEAEEQRTPYVKQDYPRLKFKLDDAGKLVETVVFNATSEAALGPAWTDAPPFAPPATAEERLKAELDALSEEDRAFVLEAQRKARLDRLQAQLSTLSDARLDAVAGAPAKGKKGK